MSEPLPDCPSCSAANTLEQVHGTDIGDTYCICSCCGKQCRVGHDGIAHRSEPLPAITPEGALIV